MINITDITNIADQQTVTLHSLKSTYQQYHFYANCLELHPTNYKQLQSLITQACQNNHIVTCAKHKQQTLSKRKTPRTFSKQKQKQLRQIYSQELFDLIKKQPQFLFSQNRHDQHYRKFQSNQQLLKQRRQFLQQQLIQTKDEEWGKMSLQELQYVNGISLVLLTKIIKNN